jgi:cold-inducible RNA-binding protein
MQPSIISDPYGSSLVGMPRDARRKERTHMARKLYVGNLPFQTEEQDLRDLFAGAGTVDTINIVRDQATGQARGFAFIEMSSDEDAQNAISTLNNYQLGGRALTVNEARPKPQRSGGFGGGGNGSGNGRRRSEPRW